MIPIIVDVLLLVLVTVVLKVKLTALGSQVAGELRAHLAKKHNYGVFSPSFGPAVTS